MEKTRYARDLGLLEKYQLSRHQLTSPTRTCITGHIIHRPKQEYENDRSFFTSYFAPVVARLLNRHPILSVTIKEFESAKVHFEHLSTIDLHSVIQCIEPDESGPDGPAGQMMHAGYEIALVNYSAKPLWSIGVCPIDFESCFITLSVHNIISDRMGVAVLWRELIEELNNGLSMEEQKQLVQQQLQNNWIVMVPTDNTLELPYELSNPPALSFFKDTVALACNLISSEILPKSIFQHMNPSEVSWKGDSPKIKSSYFYPETRLFKVESSEWQPIMKKAEENGISADAVSFVCILLAWTKVYPDDDNVVETIIPVNGRAMCNPPVPEIRVGNFSGFYSTFWTNDSELRDYQKNPWVLAKKHHNNFQKNKLNSARQPLLLKYLPDYPSTDIEFMKFKLQSSDIIKHGGIEFTDFGRLDVPTTSESGWKVNYLYAYHDLWFRESPFCINTATANDNLYCTFTCDQGVIENENVDQLISAFKDNIKAFLEN